MRIHLMQHGQFLSEALDPHQPLNPVGRELTEKSARAARSLGLRFELVVASPKLRSRQTAEIMAKTTGYPVSRITETEAVKAMASPRDAIAFISEYEGLDSILVVGHQPSIGTLAAHLLGSDGLALTIENSGLLQIGIKNIGDKGTLNWHLSPTQLALIAGG
jgi:phosphohistidine phosphatase